ncbi:MAG: hypothetical protein CME59_19445 [Halioglobus sp.]|nr:hypothetical protein [Halioglobus sp.]
METSVYHRLSNLLWGVLVTLLLVLAVYVGVGRLVTANLGPYQTAILQELNLRTPFDIEADHVSGQWQSFTPFIVLTELRIGVPGNERSAIRLAEGRIGLDVLDSLRTGSLQVTRLVLDGLELDGELDAQGRLRLTGLEGGAGETGAWLREFLLNVEFVSLRRNLLRLALPGGEVRELDLDLMLSRDGSARQVEAQLASTGGATITALASGRGDPFRPQTFSGDLYLDIDTTDLGAVRDMLANAAPAVWAQGNLDLELWLSWDHGRPRVQTRVDARDVLVTPRDGAWSLPLHRLSLQAELAREREHWTLFAADVEVANAGGELALPRLQLDSWGNSLRLRAADLSLQPLHAFAAGVESLPQNLREVFAALDPAGRVDALQISLGDANRPADDWEVEAEFAAVSVAPYRGAPGGSGLRGYARLGPGGGGVVVDSSDVSLAFPQVYRQPLAFDELYGSLDLAWSGEQVRLTSGVLTARGEEGTARALFSLDIPLVSSEIGPDMTLLVGLRDSTPQYRSKYLPYVLNQGLLDWLSASIGGGVIDDGAFLWRGSLRPQAVQRRTVQLAFNVRDTALDYHPDWPAVTIDDGVVLIDDGRVSVWADSGRLSESAVQNLSVETWVNPRGAVSLGVQGAITGPAGDGLAVVNNSPLSGLVGDAFSQWSLRGDMQADLRLQLELGDNPPPPRVEVQTRWLDVDMDIAPGNLPVRGLHGDFAYSSARGFSASELRGRLWGGDISARLEQTHSGAGYDPASSVLTVQVATDVAMAELREWLGLGALAFSSGEASAGVGVRIAPGQPPTLTVDSDLQGVQLDLPQPWQKEAAESLPLHLEMPLAGDRQVIELSLGEELNLALDITAGGLHGGSLGINEAPAAPRQGLFHVAGRAEVLHAQAWLDWVNTYLLQGAMLQAQTPTDPAPATPDPDMPAQQSAAPLRVQVQRLYAETLALFGREFDAVQLSLDLDEQAWRLDLDTDWLTGNAVLDRASGVTAVEVQDLDLSRLAALTTGAGAARAAGGSSLEVPPMQVKIASLRQAERQLGELSFSVVARDGVLTASDVRGQLARATVGAEEPASLIWRQGADGETRVRAALGFADFGDILDYLGYQRILQTGAGAIDLDLRWPGDPAAFALAAAGGTIEVDIGKGNFLSAPTGAAGALRVVSILNLVDIVQRLSLAHMFESGIPFDAVDGEIYLHEGTIEVPRLDIKGPSSFRFSGVSDIERQTLRGELVATLPVAKNLPWVAALAASLPVAAGVFVVSQIFDKQMNRMSSAVYAIEGTWDEPQVSFDRIFDDSPQELATAQPRAADPPAPAAEEERLAVEPADTAAQEEAVNEEAPAALTPAPPAAP